MQSYRFRDCTAGVTRISLRSLKKHLDKIGKPRDILGYSVNYKPCKTRPYGTNEIRVRVRGEDGYLVLKGFLWGYGGEGPSGLKQLFKKLGVLDPEYLMNVLSHADHEFQSLDEFGVQKRWEVNFLTASITIHKYAR
jgi:hypothetical protein